MLDAAPAPLVQVDGLKMHFPIYTGVLRRHTGDVKAVDGVSFSIPAGETLGLALGPFLYAGVLALGGYVSSTDAAAAQPDSARAAIALGFTVLPALLVGASLLVLRRYRLDPEVRR